MNRYLPILILLCALFAPPARSQDALYSQNTINSLYLNPAFAGSKEVLRFSSSMRWQWVTALDKITYNTFAADCNINNLGIGILANVDKSGVALKYTDISGIISYRLGNVKKFTITPAIQFSNLQRNLDWSKLKFYDQYSSEDGFLGSFSQANQDYQNVNIFDVSAGVTMRCPIEMHRTEPAWADMGIALYHIPQKDLSYLGITESPYPRKLVVHGGFLFNIFKRDSNYLHSRTGLILYPNFVFQQHGKYNSSEIGSYVYYKPFFAGLHLRSSEFLGISKTTRQAIISAGFEGVLGKYIAYQLSYSFDYAFGGVRSKITPNFLTHELGVILLFSPKRKMNCNSDLDYKQGRWYDTEKTQRRRVEECYPYKKPRKNSKSMRPLFYPYNYPVVE